MRWQRVAQIALAAVVVVFITAVAASLRKEKTTAKPEQPPPPPPVRGTELYNPDGATIERFDGDRKVLEAVLGPHTKFPDGRLTVTGRVRVLTNRNGKDLLIVSKEADIKLKQQEPPGIETATFKRDVVLTTADGVEIRSAEASYTEADGMVRIPGAVEFKKDRTSGGGQGATYDRNRDVLWILDQARMAVGPDPQGQGAMDGSAATGGLARPEHYIKLSKDARINSGGRAMQADEITITLTMDNERIQMMQLRGNSRIAGGEGGPQSMIARDIDLTYAADGRTLQTAHLVERASVEMAGSAGGKRIAAQTITIGMGPDGSTVTHLAGNQNVQVDIPAENNSPAKQIRSAALVASGAPNVGLKTATFSGKVEFRETQPATAKTPAVDRTARAETLVVETKPGLGAIEKADFRGNVKFDDAPDLKAEAQRGIYYIEKDRVELMPADGVPGPQALINDGKISVGARTIDFTIASRDLNADTRVKSTILVKKDRSARGQQQARVPSIFKQDEPAFVTANKLHYQGAAATATYTGDVNMWQGNDTKIKADKIVLDDKNGNLSATGNVVTELSLIETNTKTGESKRTQMLGKSESFVYEERRRLAVYTTKAHITGSQGDITADRIELFLKPAGTNELERAEAYAKGEELVVVKEGLRTARGNHLTYTAADEQYLMIGTPVTTIDEENGMCRVGHGASGRFFRGVEAKWQIEGNNIVPAWTENVSCASLKR
jgi:lipopolysaccharide transport protein LptA